MYLHHIDSSMGFFHTFTRLDPIAAGELVALHPRWIKHAWMAAPVALWLLYAGEFEFLYLFVALTFAGIVVRAVTGGCEWLRATPLRFAGKISYGIYIFHPIAYAIFWKTPMYWGITDWPHANLFRMVAQVLFPVPFAIASWYLFEKPLLGLKKYFEGDDEPRESNVVPLTVSAEAGSAL